jgi:hypothetical protein
MSRYLKWVFRPTVLIAFSILLVAAAMAVVVPFEAGPGRPQPLPLRPGEQEIAWLYPATSTTQWERLATAVEQARDRLEERFPGLRWSHDGPAGPAHASPSVSLSWPDGRLVFRWYKLTSQWTPRDWVEALRARDPPPLAVIGGNNSFWARELAVEMRRAAADPDSPANPLLLLTTATADRVREDDAGQAAERFDDDGPEVPLWSIYPGRTFRFCFTNRQMATAVTRFIWARPELTPDGDTTFLVRWSDDAYSRDLCEGYLRVLLHRAADSVLPHWAFLSGGVGLGLPPAALVAWHADGFRHEAALQIPVDSSVGSFGTPNPYEANAVVDLLTKVRHEQRRPLLVLTGQQQPSRRFLRELARTAPDTARRFVVAAGDALSFNTIYRDRQVAWPIQDLPFRLVFFAHRNPTDPDAGFLPAAQAGPSWRRRTSGTEDVLLFRDIVEAVALASRRGGGPPRDADDLAEGLRQHVRIAGDRLTLTEGVRLFDDRGQRAGGTGEHVIYLRPHFVGEWVSPSATIEVWARQADRSWAQVGLPLSVSFNEFEVHRGERLQ